MQLQLDWARRDRCAHQMDSSLREVGVCLSQRAAAILIFTHEQSQLIDPARQIMVLKTSYRQAVGWLRHKSDLYRNLDLHPSSLHESVSVWCAAGVMRTWAHPTHIGLCGTALRDWHAGRQFDPEEFARSWTHQQTPVGQCSGVSGSVQGCSGPYHSSERVSDGDISFSQDRNTHSLTHSEALPPLPVEVWDRQCTEKRLCDALRAWWLSEGLHDRGYRPDDVLGAILAARHNNAVSPQGYVERCVALGVRDGWRQRAALLLQRTRPAQAVVAPPLSSAPRKKPPRVIGLRHHGSPE